MMRAAADRAVVTGSLTLVAVVVAVVRGQRSAEHSRTEAVHTVEEMGPQTELGAVQRLTTVAEAIQN